MIQATIIKGGRGENRWYIPGRVNLGSWYGPPPRGACYLTMGWIDLFTGKYELFGPKGKLP